MKNETENYNNNGKRKKERKTKKEKKKSKYDYAYLWENGSVLKFAGSKDLKVRVRKSHFPFEALQSSLRPKEREIPIYREREIETK